MVRQNSISIPTHKKKLSKEKSKEITHRLIFQDCIKPAPIAIKPFSSLINPFRHGCSIFCNHPTKNVELKVAIEKTKRKKIDDEREAEIMGRILEDIICKYGTQSIDIETVITTPENEVLPPPRPQLVLNLRRTTSQETGRTSGGFQSTFSPSPSSLSGQNIKIEPNFSVPAVQGEHLSESRSEAEEEGKPELIKRRGKIRKKKKKLNAGIENGEKEVIDLIEPNDTMVSTCKADAIDYESDDLDINRNRSASKCYSSQPTPPMMESDLFDYRTLRHLRRNLSVDDIEAEFRRIVIIDALGEIMGRPFDEEETIEFKETVDLKDEDQICLRAWLGLCAFSERFYGEKFCSGKAEDCGERDLIEILDFECLENRMDKLNLNPTMVKLLKSIQNA